MNIKRVRTKDYNYNFFLETGLFYRWGKNIDDDPFFSPLGPELLDVEVSTICHGINNMPCPWCYKSNTPKGSNMSYDTFKTIFHKIPKNLTQIAFGIGDIDANPELFDILNYCRDNSYNCVVPNITINGWNLTDAFADKLAATCGAVAVSNYDKEITYNAVSALTKRIGIKGYTLKQVNIHQLTSLETYNKCWEVIKDRISDPRLKDLNAIVFLAFKNKGRVINYHSLPEEYFKKLVDYCLNANITIGMDSCSALKFLNCIKDHEDYKKFETLVEGCESGLFSFYINVDGKSYFCSFLEKMPGIHEFDLITCSNFLKEIWFHPEMNKWRNNLLSTVKNNELYCRECLYYKI